jgi:alpha-beta hydrolase superfamily lysophospholipase
MSSSVSLRNIQQPVSCSTASFDGSRITFDLYDAPSRTVVLVIPGFWRDRRHVAMRRLASFINAQGFAAAVCDLRGHGESEGVFGFNFSEHHDIAAISNEILRQRSYELITLLGFSYGGAIAISAAARDSLPVASLILISSVADFGMVSPRINPFTLHRHIEFGQALRPPRFEWRAARSPKLSALDDVTAVHAPICLIHVKDDWLIDHSHSIALYERANEPRELHIIDIPGHYHADRIFNVAAEQVDHIVSTFLARYAPK